MTNIEKLKKSLFKHASKKLEELFPNESDLAMTVENTEDDEVIINVSITIGKKEGIFD